MAIESDPAAEDRKQSAVPTEGREQRIRELAYTLWERAGRPEGPPIEFWLEAEKAMDEGDPRENERPA
jgi:hypothetical protein